jgi:thiamine pyrophosphokinase
MKYVVVCNGEAPSLALLQREMANADQVIACDGGAETLAKYDLCADLMVGDFDSLGQQRANELAAAWQCEMVTLEVKKDKTDTQVAVELAMAAGAKEMVLLGALGGRFDHALGNAWLLVQCERMGVKAVIYDEQNEIRVTCTVLILPGKVGDMLSILPMGVNSRIRCTDGLAYPIYDRDLNMGDTLTLSNRYDAEEALIDVAHGWVCVIRSHD